VLILAFAMTAWLTSPERVTELGVRLAELLPADIGAPDAVERLGWAGGGLSPVNGVLALLPVSL